MRGISISGLRMILSYEYFRACFSLSLPSTSLSHSITLSRTRQWNARCRFSNTNLRLFHINLPMCYRIEFKFRFSFGKKIRFAECNTFQDIRHCRRARRETANRRETFSGDLCIRDKRIARATCNQETTINVRAAYITGKGRKPWNIYHYVRFTFINSMRIAERWDQKKRGGQEFPRGERLGQKSRCLRLSTRKFRRPFEILWSSLKGILAGKEPRENLSREKSASCVSRRPFHRFFFSFFPYARFVAGRGWKGCGLPRFATATKNRSIAPAGVVHLFPTLHNISPWATDDFPRLPFDCLYLPLSYNGTSLSAVVSCLIDAISQKMMLRHQRREPQRIILIVKPMEFRRS